MFQNGMVYHFEKKMCISETCFRLAPCKLCDIEGRQQYIFLIHCIRSSPTFVTEKQTNKQTTAGWPYFWSLFTAFYASGLHLTCDFDMTKFCTVQI